MFDPHEQMHPDVEDIDLVEIAEYIIPDNPDAARAVLEAIRDTFLILAREPLLGTEYHPIRQVLRGIRMFPVTAYPNYLIYYRPLPDNTGVRILYVLNAARDAATYVREQPRQ
jgi:plasmid stabilization system protein ParE